MYGDFNFGQFFHRLGTSFHLYDSLWLGTRLFIQVCFALVGFTSVVLKNWRDHWLPSVPPALRSTRKLS